MTHNQLDRYLGLLGVGRRDPTLDLLAQLVCAHLERVPFENVSKLYRLRRSGLRDVPDLEQYLDGIEYHRLGGTCYANNTHLCDLLVALGYTARLHGADMSRPDVHVVIVVELDGQELLVDAGYGAPFLAPMPLQLERDHAVTLGRDRYVLRPRDARGRSALELYREGRLRHGYIVQPMPRDPSHFRTAVAESFRPDATFMNAVVIACFSRTRTLVLRNLSILEVSGERENWSAVGSRGELGRIAEAAFGIPREITDEALAAVKDFTADPWA